MTKKKSPFVNYTEEEVFASEFATYFIQVGSDVFNLDGRWVFSKKSASIYYNKILRQLLDDMINGEERDRKNAERVLLNLKVVPLKLH